MEETVYTEKKVRRSSAEIRLLRDRIVNAIITVIVIAYLTILGLLLAERGREHLPARPFEAIWQSGVRLVDYFTNHPETYYWYRQNIPVSELLGDILVRSAGLLLCSMGVALVLGILLGVSAALSKGKLSSGLMV
ncbi:MAG TPA: hypothetical protein VFQ13_09345, partial [Anaerolineales bacterium]|nr:hypothetical protein [Anaerolineales bacterium]